MGKAKKHENSRYVYLKRMVEIIFCKEAIAKIVVRLAVKCVFLFGDIHGFSAFSTIYRTLPT